MRIVERNRKFVARDGVWHRGERARQKERRSERRQTDDDLSMKVKQFRHGRLYRQCRGGATRRFCHGAYRVEHESSTVERASDYYPVVAGSS